MQHQQIYFHTYFNLKCYLFACGVSIYTCTHTESHATADQTLPTSVCGGGTSGEERSLLLSRCICTAGVPSLLWHEPHYKPLHLSSSASRISSSYCPVHSASPTLGSLLYSPLGLCLSQASEGAPMSQLQVIATHSWINQTLILVSFFFRFFVLFCFN